ncbi:redoxin domain-containing protein [candidate division WOR-3 bacterium]|uniref:Redoxin domain-containing protein n=1 Tax=candidate division WOR-3 bacterium TaxID=2052148 RepID=A0A9D5KC65_UNCW3|nr:redoxin domain-containing protein [candidate division WOR-3 bacterium]MBD3365479.1 redoxin domain-containing protein [candidate division WOR-3 bacterium]
MFTKTTKLTGGYVIIKRTMGCLSLIAVVVSAQTAIVDENPANPVAGKQASWTVASFDRDTDNPLMIISAYLSDTTLPFLIEGQSTAEGWRFRWEIPEDVSYAGYRIEDDRGPLLDKKSGSIPVQLYNPEGKPAYNNNLYQAVMLYDSQYGDLEVVKELLEKELNHYPNNWTALHFLRSIEVETGERTVEEIIAKFDSLLAEEPDSLEMLHFVTLQYKFSFKDWIPDGEKLLEKCVERYPKSKYWVKIQGIIYNALSQVPGRLGYFERSLFGKFEGDAKEAAYMTVLSHAAENRDAKHMEELVDSFFDEFPSEKLPIQVIIALLQTKYPQPNSQWAEEVDEWLDRYPDAVDLNMMLAYYYKDRDWKKAVKYFRNAAKNSDSPQPVVEFAEATAAKGKNLAEVRKYLKETIDDINMNRYRKMLPETDFQYRHKVYTANKALLYNSLGNIYLTSGDYKDAVENLLKADSFQTLIPGYEKSVYTRLLEASQKAGDLSARKKALLNLLSSEPENTEFMIALSDIYTVEHGSKEGFRDWLKEESQQIHLRFRLNQPLPDFSLMGADGDTLSLSDFQGKVLVINFWGTTCGPCIQEIPQLNELMQSYEDENDMIFLAVANEKPEKVNAFLEENEFTYRHAYELPTMEATRLFQIEAIPTHLVIDRKGYLQFEHVGFSPDLTEILTMEIDALLQTQ